MRKNSVPLRLSDSVKPERVSAAQSAMIFLPHPHSSDVFLFLRGEGRGRGEIVMQDGHGAFLKNCLSGRIRRVTSFLHKKCRVLQYIPPAGRRQRQCSID